MADSPLSSPGTPRTASPLPSDGDFARSLSPSQDDAQPLGGAQGQNDDDVWTATPAPGTVKATASASAEQVTIAKGKEKAAKSPLKLLDLPMDILKEIIHQVSSADTGAAPIRVSW